jgi:hypothetical protein
MPIDFDYNDPATITRVLPFPHPSPLLPATPVAYVALVLGLASLVAWLLW